ncbi:TRAP transporter small permease [Tianweitania sediminis]|uniref:TRAP transporter small permease protein n=1 Tax=Tianweitania sediminis TaxID=1502156 RepID=A0A8J7R1W0_9HYPH|nr:TRAP transporter small permease [Tianweitania sediminis]MBP0440705.1 TRAP transporter small permease [Tianweitania sediminis]
MVEQVEETRLRSLAYDFEEATRDADLHQYDPSTPRILRVVDRIAEGAGVAIMVVITLLIFANATGRYTMGMPLVWADELVIALMPWLTMTGLFLSVRRGSVIRIEYFFYRLPPSLRPATQTFTSLLSAIAFTYLAFYSLQLLQLFGSDLSPYLRIRDGWFTSALLIGSIASSLVFLVQAFITWRDRGGSRAQPS